MIPINLTDSESIIRTLSDDTESLGSASPREVLFFFLSLVIAYLLGLIVAHYLKIKLSHRLKPDQLNSLIMVEKILLFVIAVAISIPSLLNLSLTIMLIASAGAIAVIGLSSQKVISNLVGGLAIMYESPFAQGDFISIGDISGTVVSMRLFSVRIRTTNGVYIHIPNDAIYSSNVSNYHANVARRYDYTIGIRYQDNVAVAKKIISDILDCYTFVLKNPVPQVFVSDIDADSVLLTVRCWFPSGWADTRDDVSLMTDILPRIKTSLEAAGIEMPYVHREIILTASEKREKPDNE